MAFEAPVMLYGDSMLARFTKPRVLQLEQAIGTHVLPAVLNCAVGGWDSADGLRKAPYMAKVGAPVIVLSFGMNDCAPWRVLPTSVFSTNMVELREVFAGSHLIGFLPPSVSENPGADPNRRINSVLDEYREIMRRVIGSKYCLDVNGILEGSAFAPLEVDGVHLSDESYSKVIPHLAHLVKDGL